MTKKQVDEIERLLRASGTNVGLNDLLVKIAEDGIEKVIASGGKYLPTNRDRWAFRKV